VLEAVASAAVGLAVVVVVAAEVVAAEVVAAEVVAADVAAVDAAPPAELSLPAGDPLVLPAGDPLVPVAVCAVAICGVGPVSFAAPVEVVTETVGVGGGVDGAAGRTGGGGVVIAGGGAATLVTTGALASAFAFALAEFLPGFVMPGTSE
jgi:hypothetical protein